MSAMLDDILRKSNIQNIREFLLHGVEVTEISEKSFETRKKEAYDTFLEELKKQMPDLTDDSEIYMLLNELLITYENVYIEMGLVAGANLSQELLNKNSY